MTATGHVDADLAHPSDGRRSDIQGLRALAVGAVVLSHMGVTQMEGGFVGVDVFFVISGFLITGLLLNEARKKRQISLSGFYARRALRILPMSTLVLAATALVTFFALGRVRATDVFNETIWAMLFAANWKFSIAGTDYFNDELPPSPLQHYWSLAIEEQFYLVWPALMGILLIGTTAFRSRARRRTRRFNERRVTVAIGVILGISAASLAYSAVYTASQPAGSYFSTFSRVWELGLGAALALAASRLTSMSPVLRSVMGWSGLAGIVVSILLISEAVPFPGIVALAPVASTLFVIAAGIGSGGSPNGAGKLLGWTPLRWLGDCSYSLYLWHWPLLIVTAAYVGDDVTLTQNALLMVGAVLLSALTYRFVEKPIQTRGRTVTHGTGLLLWPASVTALLVMVLFGVDSLRTSELTAIASAASPAASVDEAAVPAGLDETQAAAWAAAQPAALEVPVPAGLSPPLSEVRDDIWRGPDILADECFSGPGKPGEPDTCPVGPEDGPRIVLMGDSQAGMWWPAVRQLAEEAGWRAYPIIRTACSPVDVLTWHSKAAEADRDCQAWREWALTQIAKLQPDLAVVSYRGSYMAVGSDGKPLEGDANDLATKQGLESTLGRLGQVSERVVQLHDSPRGGDPVACLDAPEASLSSCALPYPDDTERANELNERAAAASGSEFVDLTSWFCAEGTCPLVIDDIVVYFTPGHITRTMAEHLAPALAVRLGVT